MIKIKTVDAIVYRFPIETPVQTSFGTMIDRPMVLVKLVDEDGVTGYGEVWCNYPSVGAEHRARLVKNIFAPLISSKSFASPRESFELLTNKTWVLSVQTGEYGPIAQCIAGIDIAIHDLHARKLSLPLWKLLGGTSDKVSTYGSGISQTAAEKTAELALDAGHNALKLKVEIDTELDIQNISSLRKLLGKDGKLMVDPNQAWTAEQAKVIIDKIEPFDLEWLEEPILADRPDDEWYSLAAITNIPLAAGENISGENRFSHLISEKYLEVIQPDLAKWGGLTQTVPLAKKIIRAKKKYCPHFLGGGIGLLASAHALAAVGGFGLLELDCNPNPLRTSIVKDFFDTSLNTMKLGNKPGIGVVPDLNKISKYRVA